MSLVWSDWEEISDPPKGLSLVSPVAMSRGGGLDLFAGADGRVFYNGWRGSWTGWDDLHGKLRAGPAIASRTPETLDIVCIGADHRMYYKGWDGTRWIPSREGWSKPIGGVVGDWAPSLVSWGPNRLDVFAIGTADQLLHLSSANGKDWFPQKGGAPEWEDLGGKITSKPVAVSWGPDRLDIFVRGTDNGVFHKAWDGKQWRPSKLDWEPLGGETLDEPAAVSWGPGRLDVFTRAVAEGEEGYRIQHLFWDDGWGPVTGGKPTWEPLGTPFGRGARGGFDSAPSVASWGPGRLDVFATGRNVPVPGGVKIFNVFRKSWDRDHWTPDAASGWETLEGVFLPRARAVAIEDGRLAVFAAGRDEWGGSLRWKRGSR